MQKFITARPEVASADFGSPYDPVLAGVAQGLSRLFPPVQQARPRRSEAADRASAPRAAARRTGAATGGGARG